MARMSARDAALVVLLACPAAAPAAARGPTPEERTARRLEAIRSDPVALRAFLRALPKGGDLHTHLSGAVYAESYIRWAAEDGFCVDTRLPAIAREKEPCDAANSRRPAKEALADPALYAALIDSLSMRNHHPSRKPSAYQFFDSFPRFSAVSSVRRGDMLAEIARGAAAQNVLYLELTSNWDLQNAVAAAARVEWTEDFAALRERLLDAGIREAPKSAALDAAEARMREALRCGTPEADPGCGIAVRYHAESLRAFAPVQVFAMLVWSFEQSRADPRFVGINLVQPEDWHVPVRDYDLHMRMIEHLRGAYPQVAVSLHAGELALGQVPPEVLGTHIEQAVRRGGARRIGHGTDVAYHPRPAELMEEMRQKDVAVEVCLSSAEHILGVRADCHPLRSYLRAGVPVVLATDDEGVARSDLTNEYFRAVTEHGLTYRQIRKISRDSLRYAFLKPDEKAALLARLDAALAAFEALEP
jgi:hypothetical protein